MGRFGARISEIPLHALGSFGARPGSGPLRRGSGPVKSRGRVNPSEEKTPGNGKRCYRRTWPESLPGAAVRGMTGRTVDPQVDRNT